MGDVRLLALLIALGCASAPVQPVAAQPAPTVDTTLGAGDVFDVRVFGEQDLSGTYRVDPQGRIDYPLAGRLEVAGLQPGDLAKLLRERLVAFVRDPQVSVFVRETSSKRFTVYGQVQKPGTYPYTNAMTISQAISLAGGFTGMAARDRVRISHIENNQQRLIEVNLLDIANGRAPNHFIVPGDEVYVPERLF
jgi:polysaccharide export outer membrane protein